jgi:hypothetical protein
MMPDLQAWICTGLGCRGAPYSREQGARRRPAWEKAEALLQCDGGKVDGFREGEWPRHMDSTIKQFFYDERVEMGAHCCARASAALRPNDDDWPNRLCLGPLVLPVRLRIIYTS